MKTFSFRLERVLQLRVAAEQAYPNPRKVTAEGMKRISYTRSGM